MYFPIFRGKQNELLALKELINKDKLSNKIVPIIEPVKASSTFRNLLVQFSETDKKIAVIQNSSLIDYVAFKDPQITDLKTKKNFIPAIEINNYAANTVNNQNSNRMVLIGEKTEVTDLSLINKDTYVVVEPNNRTALRKIKNKTTRLIEVHDQFEKQARNADYSNVEDETFSSEHLYYNDEGYFGFSDYSIIGKDYVTSGFAAKAVTIHFVYFDSNDELRVHHFVSDTNDDIRNPALKAHEALDKLNTFVHSNNFDRNKNNSQALERLVHLFDEDEYSGLGYFKRLSIEHHLEIMGRYLDR
jgi:hypothetical protein